MKELQPQAVSFKLDFSSEPTEGRHVSLNIEQEGEDDIVLQFGYQIQYEMTHVKGEFI